MAEYTVFERDLVEASGVSRSAISKKRREILIENNDYGLVKNATAYTAPAALRLLVGLGVASPSNVLEMALAGVHDEKSALDVGVVIKRFQPNTAIMVCKLEKSGDQVTVRVRDNNLFEIGQRIPLKKSADGMPWLLDAPQPRRRGHIPGFEGGK
jgi:hypothetical protein